MEIKLSDNERGVLKILIRDGRTPCTAIAKKLGITSQAVGKIQEKLKREGIIRGYSADIDYEKLGITVFAVALFRFKSGSWSRLENEDIKSRVKGAHLMKVYRFSEGEVTHMVVYGFRSLKELDNYFHILQTERGHISELKKIYIFSANSILKDSGAELITKTIEERGVELLARPDVPPAEYPQA